MIAHGLHARNMAVCVCLMGAVITAVAAAVVDVSPLLLRVLSSP